MDYIYTIGFPAIILLAANSANYLQLSVVVQSKTVCNMYYVLSVN